MPRNILASMHVDRGVGQLPDTEHLLIHSNWVTRNQDYYDDIRATLLDAGYVSKVSAAIKK